MSLSELSFSLVLNALLRRSAIFSPATAGEFERKPSSPLRTASGGNAVAEAAIINWRRFIERSLGVISDDLISLAFLINIGFLLSLLRAVFTDGLAKSLQRSAG